jgi:hypothetical protein
MLGVEGRNATPAKKAESIKRLCGSVSVHIQKVCCAHSSLNMFITLLRAAP